MIHQPNLFGTDLLMQLDPGDPLLKLASTIPWQEFEESLSIHYTAATGAPSKPIRLMVGLLILKQLENLSDESIVLQWKRNPYYQAFCGMKEFQQKLPCHSTELVHFRKRIGAEGVERIFRMSVVLHGNRRWKMWFMLTRPCMRRTSRTQRIANWRSISSIASTRLAPVHGISQRRTFVKAKSLRLDIRHYRHVKKRVKGVTSVEATQNHLQVF